MQKAAVFDFGRVIFNTWHYADFVVRFSDKPRTLADGQHFQEHIFTRALRNEACRGDAAPILNSLSAQYPEWADVLQNLQQDKHYQDLILGLNEGMADALSAAKHAGIKLYGLTNWPADSFNVLVRQYSDTLDLLDGVVVSGEVKLIKPDPAIYHHAQQAFNLTSGMDVFFFDDKPPNVTAAQASVGWQGHVFKDAAQVRQVLGL